MHAYMKDFIIFEHGIVAAAIAAGGFALGFVLEKIALARIISFAARTQWTGDDVLLASLRNLLFPWIFLTGLFLGLSHLLVSAAWIGHIQKGYFVLSVFIAAIFISRLVHHFFQHLGKASQAFIASSSIISNISKVIIFILGGLIIAQSFGVSITPMLTALGVGGLAVALALQETLSNLFAGIHIILARQIRPGDYIKVNGDNEGYVTDISWRATTIRALPNNLITIPNAKIASAVIINFDLPEREMALLVNLGVAYDSDLAHVERVTIATAREVLAKTEGGVTAGFDPFTGYHTFGDSSIGFTVILRVKQFVDQYLVKHEFIKALHQAYRKEKIVIPFPIRTLYMAEGQQPKERA